MDMEPVSATAVPASDPSSTSIEDLADEYFSSVNSIAKNFIREKEVRKQESSENWKNLSQAEKDSALNEWFLDDGIRLRYEIRSQGSTGQMTQQEDTMFENYPKMKLECGSKVVHYTESNHSAEQVITWKDEFSAPFSWDTKCQRNLGLYASDDPPSRTETSDLNCSRESTSTDLDSSELFSRLKDKASRLDNDDINIHVNPSYNLEYKPAGLTTPQLESRIASQPESQAVITQPKAAPKPTIIQRKPSASKADSPGVVKPSRLPPSTPGSIKFAITSNHSSSQSSAVSRSSSISSTSSRPSKPPPSKPSSVLQKPSQPSPTTPSKRPVDTPPPPPPEIRSKPDQEAKSRPPSLPREMGDAMQSSVKAQEDLKQELGGREDAKPIVGSGDSPAGEKVEPNSDAAFDFLLQW